MAHYFITYRYMHISCLWMHQTYQKFLVGNVTFRQGDFKDFWQHLDFITTANKVFVNNAEGVFASRSNEKGGKMCDDYIASFFGRMKPNTIMVTCYEIFSLGNSIKDENDLRAEKGLPPSSDASFFECEVYDIGDDATTWGGELKVWVYKRASSNTFLCSDVNCPEGTNILRDGEMFDLVDTCIYCGKNRSRRTRQKRKVDKLSGQTNKQKKQPSRKVTKSRKKSVRKDNTSMSTQSNSDKRQDSDNPYSNDDSSSNSSNDDDFSASIATSSLSLTRKCNDVNGASSSHKQASRKTTKSRKMPMRNDNASISTHSDLDKRQDSDNPDSSDDNYSNSSDDDNVDAANFTNKGNEVKRTSSSALSKFNKLNYVADTKNVLISRQEAAVLSIEKSSKPQEDTSCCTKQVDPISSKIPLPSQKEQIPNANENPSKLIDMTIIESSDSSGDDNVGASTKDSATWTKKLNEVNGTSSSKINKIDDLTDTKNVLNTTSKSSNVIDMTCIESSDSSDDDNF